MDQKTILITGARNGIGKDAALELARKGHRVIATTRTQIEADELAREVEKTDLNIVCKKLDVLDDADHARIDEYKPDVLICNAAIGESGPLAEIPRKYLVSAFETNVFATIALTQRAVPHMLERKHGRIILISSIAGRIVLPYLGPYSMTKFALEAAADALRQELKPHGIQVVLIEPGAIATGFNERMNAAKYKWFNERSRFWADRERIAAFEGVLISKQHPTTSVTRGIVHAVEGDHPLTRYIRPWNSAILTWFAQVIPDPIRDWYLSRRIK